MCGVVFQMHEQKEEEEEQQKPTTFHRNVIFSQNDWSIHLRLIETTRESERHREPNR